MKCLFCFFMFLRCFVLILVNRPVYIIQYELIYLQNQSNAFMNSISFCFEIKQLDLKLEILMFILQEKIYQKIKRFGFKGTNNFITMSEPILSF